MTEYTFHSRLNRRDEHHYLAGTRADVNIAMVALVVARGEPPDPSSQAGPDSAYASILRFRQRLRRTPFDIAPPVWQEVPGFVPSHHVRSIELGVHASFGDVLRVADEIINEPFDLDEPLWRIVQLTGLPGGRFARLLKLHHVFSDGVALRTIFAKLLLSKLEAQIGAPLVDVVAGPPPRSMLVEFLDHLSRHGRDAAAALGRMAVAVIRQGDELTALLDEVRAVAKRPQPAIPRRGRRMASCVFVIPAEAWDRAAADRHGSANDLYIAVAAKVTHALLSRCAVAPSEVVVGVPVGGRDDAQAQDAGNVASAVDLRCRPGRDIRDLRELHSSLKRALTSHAERGRASLLDPLERMLPGRMQASLDMRRYSSEHVVASNLGSAVPMAIADAPIEHLFVLPPSIGAPISLGMVRYDGGVHLSATCDVAALEPVDVERELNSELSRLLGPAVATGAAALFESARTA